MKPFLPLALFAALGCAPARDGAVAAGASAPRASATLRAARRAFDGAPPVIPHTSHGGACVSCHTRDGLEIGGLGFAPASPHDTTPGMGATARCEQCHVYQTTLGVFVDNGFVGLRQDLRRGARLNPLAPPVLPHQTLLRENCASCHTGPAARQEIKTPHPERTRCQQCHVPVNVTTEFERA